MTNEEKNNQFSAFDGKLLHPSLDIRDGLLCLGFRYRAQYQEEREIFLIVNNGNVQMVTDESFEVDGQRFYFEKRNRKLIRLEEKWGVDMMKQFVDDYSKGKSIIPSTKEVFQEIVKHTQRYIELECEIDYYLLTAWALGTYFSPTFNAYPFLHIKAPKRSGKSQCLNLMCQLCFNAIKAHPSLAALGDTVDSLRGTYLIDQADSLNRKGGEELLNILADSYKKSGGKRRVVDFDKRKGRRVLEFETYSPKVFASIKELPEDLRDRCLVIPLIRSQKNFPDPDDYNTDWSELRAKIYKLLIANYSVISSTYSVKKIGYRNKHEIFGRELELWLPFEVILECFGIQDRIDEAKKRFKIQYGFSEYEPSEFEEAVIQVVLNQLQDKQTVILTPKEISELVDSELYAPSDTAKQRAAKVGWVIKKFNLSSEKRPRTKEGMQYVFVKQKVEEVNKGYCKTVIEPTPHTPTTDEAENIDKLLM